MDNFLSMFDCVITLDEIAPDKVKMTIDNRDGVHRRTLLHRTDTGVLVEDAPPADEGEQHECKLITRTCGANGGRRGRWR
ncbi:MAG: hypothetical protein BWY09_02556 [Candidatus Hydrogenedentes bacterium ADurb.Bin179]|nr:MAG: hypothetical protein BWY09_02556 [Candidatus Hydrogenedentes bacterium ADurb.Bin179]